MKLASVHVMNFRCLASLSLEFSHPAVLLGPNSAGKSSLLHALAFFFDGVNLEPEDVFDGKEETVSVECTFTELNGADREAFGLYAEGDQMVLRRSWKVGEDQRLTGRGRRFPGFDAVRAQSGAAFTRAYRELRADKSELGLPEARNIGAVEQAMLTWEQDHADQCEVVDDQDASNLFGYGSVGKAKLSDRFPFVFVPGVRDAATEAVEKKNSLLSRLLTAVADQRAAADEELRDIETEARERYEAAVETTHGPILHDLGQRLSGQLQRYVPSAEIKLEPAAATVKLDPPRVTLRGGEERDLTDLGRQGHGFRRAFIISVLEYLADVTADAAGSADRPTLFLAIEEPELYQHPPRARHFYRTLSRLADEDTVQVCYATHSPYFVSADRFDAIRVFRRNQTLGKGRGSSGTRARMEDVAAQLPESDQHDPRRYLERTLSERFREGFFAKAVVLVEGPTDEAIFETAAELYGFEPLPAQGIVLASVGKSALPIALAILKPLGIPTYCIFDGDKEATDSAKCPECGSGKQKRTSAIAANKRVLAAVGGEEADFPDTQANPTWGCFEDKIESAISGFGDMVAQVQNETGWGGKSPEAYSEALRRLGPDSLPGEVREMLEGVQKLAVPEQPGEPAEAGK